MNTEELSEEIRDSLPNYYRAYYSAKEIRMILFRAVEIIKDTIATGEEVKLRGLGVLFLKSMKFGFGKVRTPKMVIRFRPSRQWKREMAQLTKEEDNG